MYFKVTYRRSDGQRTSEVFTAESREAVFPLIRARGINAISVQEVSSPKLPQNKRESKFSSKHVLFAIFAIVALGISGWWFLSGGNQVAKVRRPNLKTSANNLDAPRKKVNPLANPKGRPKVEDLRAMHSTNVTDVVESREGIPAPVPTNQIVKHEGGEKRIFKTAAEQLLSMAFADDPTMDTPPLPIDETNDLSDEEIEKGLSSIVSADEDDDEATINRKLAVIELKSEFEQLRKDEGWTFAKYVLELQHRNRMNAEFYSEACKVDETAYHDAKLTDAEYQAMRAELNKKLAERGLPDLPTAEDNQDSEGDVVEE